ncbi:Putative transcription factor, enhancer of yellow 2, transcription factor EnY2 superfamily [Septoria linicola]|uniref:Transcription factor, enhancer of yellow 2, transcription factor EnY2 superfamily n=1 Tax=Septoria linicola TaxID=215465 RepID=A0A9Q9AEL1_9PEZI|nr:putative transcription factor, enhancer of yellow 2, transcription factor EnY2 superfamily [Septoria linicola]USW47572.1 Putative transcription factor, enhancer of yellow 2, transcription factor EnY2 superfamily [Septoria linicola]
MAERKVAVNGTTSAYNPSTQDAINIALLQNGGIRRIQTSLHERLDAAGWTQSVRDYVERLFRSGEAQSYDEAMKMVMQHVTLQAQESDGRAGARANGAGVPDLSIPRDVAKDGAEVVKKELRQVVRMGDK